MSDDSGFFGAHFQLHFAAFLLRDQEFLSRVAGEITPELFPDEGLQRVIRIILHFYAEHGTAPGALAFEELDKARRDGQLSADAHLAAGAYLQHLLTQITLQNREYLFSQFDDFLWQRRMDNMLLPLADSVRGRDRVAAEEIVRKMLRADQRIERHGSDYTADATERVARRRKQDVARTWTFIPEIDAHVPGLLPGEIGLIQSRTSSDGKTAALCHLTKAAMFQGRNVLLLTGEESVHAYEDRLDMSLAGINREELVDADKIGRRIRRYTDRGRLHIYEFSPGSTRLSDLRHYAENYRASANLTPGLILIDYLDKCAPETPSLRGDVSAAGEEKFLAFEAWLKEWETPGWTVTQSGRDAAKEEFARGHNVGGSLKKIQIAHVVLSIARDDDNVTRVLIEKNRDGPRNIKLELHSDWERMLFSTQGYNL